MKKILIIIFAILAMPASLRAQTLKAVYEYIPSPVISFSESVYYENGKKLSIMDSVAINKKNIEENGDEFQSEIFILDDSAVLFKKILVQNKGSNKILQTGSLKNQNFVITDELPKIEWNTNYADTEKIGKYNCKKATANFRGSKITAYYAPEIPVSTGPFKFGGLPGLIMMLYNDGVNPNYWTITEVEYPYNEAIPDRSRYINSLPKLTLRNYVATVDKESQEMSKRFETKMPAGIDVTVESKVMRGGVEQKYEWEK